MPRSRIRWAGPSTSAAEPKEAIEILTRAAKGDPTQAEIHEHLGDALYKAGHKFEARYAWSAALVTAEDEVAARLKAKIEAGLSPATAAP